MDRENRNSWLQMQTDATDIIVALSGVFLSLGSWHNEVFHNTFHHLRWISPVAYMRKYVNINWLYVRKYSIYARKAS